MDRESRRNQSADVTEGRRWDEKRISEIDPQMVRILKMKKDQSGKYDPQMIKMFRMKKTQDKE
jgi:hypothetical protein